VAVRTERRRVGIAWVAAALAISNPGSSAAGNARRRAQTTAPAAKGPTIDDLFLRFTLFNQRGRGFQSKAGPPAGPGSENMLVFQPMGQLGIRQRNPRWTHQVTFALDVISAASPDGLDAVSSASRYNEAGELDVTTTYASEDRGEWSVRYGLHFEEPFRSGFGGLGWVGRFFEDNTTVALNTTVILDLFDFIHPLGFSPVQVEKRVTISDNVGVTQVLSPTTLVSASYGVTFQAGTLQTTWNSVAISDAPTTDCPNDYGQAPEYDCPNREPERLPRTRTRHAAALLLNQHIPRTRSTIKLAYRFYADDFDLRAHTPGVMLYQWLGRRTYLRATYRYHWQRGVSFYTVATRTDASDEMPLTADSDLAPFSAHQVGLKAVVYLLPPGGLRGAQYLDGGYSRYQRSNDLHVDVVSLGYGRDF
jgi:hypothetical protein